MNGIFLILGILLLAYAGFRIYLHRADKHFVFSGHRVDHKWKAGRFWMYVAANKDKNWKRPFVVDIEYSLFTTTSYPAFELDVAGEEFDIRFHVGFWLLGAIWITFSDTPLRRIFVDRTTALGRVTGISLFNMALHIMWLQDRAGSSHTYHSWMPKGFHFYRSMEEHGIQFGWTFEFDFDRLLLGDYLRHVDILETYSIKIPIEPDNSMGRTYTGTWRYCMEVRWRSNLPFHRYYNTFWEVETDNPPMYAGKGENDYDMDDDGIFRAPYYTESLPVAIMAYIRSVYSYRQRRGMPSWYYKENVK